MGRLAKSLWVCLAGYFIGCCNIMGINSLGIGFLGAASLCGKSTVLTYVGVFLGLATSFPLIHTVRYGIIMLAVGIVLNLRSISSQRGNYLAMSLLAGFMTSIINISVYYFLDNVIDVYQVFIEGALVFSIMAIYSFAIDVIEKDYVRIAVDNQSALSVMIFCGTVLFGMPLQVGGVISLAEAFGLFSVLYTNYKFGFGLGMSWTVIAATIMSGRLAVPELLTVWLIIALATYTISNYLGGSRGVITLLFGGIYYLMGYFFYEFLLEENSQKAVLSALFIFLLAPSRLMLRVDEKIKNGELADNSPEWGRMVISRINNLASAFKRIDYTLASDSATGIGFNDVGDIIEGFTNQLDKQVPLRKTIEARIIQELSLRDIQVKNLILVKNDDERYEVYITVRVRRGRLVCGETVKKIIEEEMKVKLVMKEESRGIVSRNYEVLCFGQKPAFVCKTAVRNLSKYDGQVCGDNFYIGDILEGQKLIIIADGMGNGPRAAQDSNSLIDAIEELLAAGFNKEMSIRLVNSYLSDKYKGETFATLDMLIIDTHTGYGKLYKQGAATTFIRRRDWLEMIKSTSLPVGVIDGAVCEKCNKKFYDGDIIVMVSDGILESIIFENKEDYMRELLLDMDMDDPEDIAGEIVDRIRAISGNRLKDDATIVVCKVVKTL